MQKWHARCRGQRGFSLIELVAVLVVTAVLVGLGYAGFSSVRTQVRDGQARDLLRTVSAAQEAQYRSRGSFVASVPHATGNPAAKLAPTDHGYVGPETDPGQDAPNVISAAQGQAYGSVPALGLATWSSSGQCFMHVTFAPGAGRAALEDAASTDQLSGRSLACSGADALVYLRVDDPRDGAFVPNTPTHPAVTAGPGLLTLRWAAPADGPTPAGYRIYRSAGTTGDTAFLADVSGATSFTDTGLDAKVTYNYHVVAYNDAGTSSRSETASGSPTDPATTTPDRPGGLTFGPVTATSITLTWKPVAAATGYRVSREGKLLAVLDADDSDGDGHTIGTQFTDIGSTTQKIPAPTGGARYNYRVEAYNADQTSLPALLDVVTPAPAPTGLTATVKDGFGDPTCTHATCVTLTWSAPPDAGATAGVTPVPLRGYRVYRCDGSTCPPGTDQSPQPAGMTLVTSVAADRVTVPDQALPGGSTFTYRVYAANAAGLSTASAGVTVRTVPGPVAGFSVTAAGAGKATVTWSPPTNGTDVTGYRVYRLTSGDRWDLVSGALPSTARSWTDTGLPGFTAVTYRVVATSAHGIGVATGPKTIGTDPAPVTGITAAATDTRVQLTWPRTSGVTYTVLRDTADVATNTLGQHTDRDLEPGTAYKYVIRATNGRGASADSIPVTVWTKPTAPTGVAATGADDTVTLTWNPTAGATRYTVFRCTGTGCVPTTETATTTQPQYTDHGLTLGTVYTYTVIATNSSGQGATSVAVAAVTKPNPVTLTATATAKQVQLSWTSAPTATRYVIHRDGQEVATVHGDVRTYTDSSTGSGRTYSYTVMAANAAGTSLPSNTVASGTAPHAPTGLIGEPAATSVTLTWVADGATRYQLFRCAGTCVPTTADLIATINDGATRRHQDTGLTALRQYTYTVKAGNTVDWSGHSAPVTVRTTLDAPADVAVTGYTATTADMAWAPVTGAVGYRVYVNDQLAAAVPGDATGTQLTGLLPGTRYQVHVAAYSAGGESPRAAGGAFWTLPGAPVATVTTSGATATVSWSTVTGATTYTVYDAETDTVACTTSGTSCQVNLSYGQSRAFQAQATGVDGGTGARSNTVTATAAPAAPGAVTATEVTSPDYTGISVTWPATPTATGYDVYRSADGGAATLVGSTAGTSLLDAGRLSSGVTYTYLVRGKNAAGQGPGATSNGAAPTWAAVTSSSTPWAMWKLDETSGTKAVDTSRGTARDATITGTPAFRVSTPATRRDGYGLGLNTEDDSVKYTGAMPSASSAATYEFSYRANSVTNKRNGYLWSQGASYSDGAGLRLAPRPWYMPGYNVGADARWKKAVSTRVDAGSTFSGATTHNIAYTTVAGTDPGNGAPNTPNGYSWFRKPFRTSAAMSNITLSSYCRGLCWVFLDGQLIVGATGTTATTTVARSVPAGDHVLAVVFASNAADVRNSGVSLVLRNGTTATSPPVVDSVTGARVATDATWETFSQMNGWGDPLFYDDRPYSSYPGSPNWAATVNVPTIWSWKTGTGYTWPGAPSARFVYNSAADADTYKWHFLRKEIDFPVTGSYDFHMGCDYACGIYVDGAAIGSLTDASGSHTTITGDKFTKTVTAGKHVVGLRVRNDGNYTTGDNHSAITFALYRAGGTGSTGWVDSLYGGTGSGWVMTTPGTYSTDQALPLDTLMTADAVEVSNLGSRRLPEAQGHGDELEFVDLTDGTLALSTGGVNLLDGKWHNIVLTQNTSTSVWLYVDGVLRSSGSLPTRNFGANGFRIGAWSNEEIEQYGDYDDVAVWSRQKTTAEIAGDYVPRQ